ncbi:hypothetical protein GCM10027068_19390 [Prescottella soli]
MGCRTKALEPCRNPLLDCATGPHATTTAVRGCIARLEHIFESDELPASEDTDRNEFHASKTLNGRVAVKGDLDSETGEMLLTALSALTKPRNPTDDPTTCQTPGRRRAEAFGEILRQYLNSGVAPVEGGERPHVSLHVNARDLARTVSEHGDALDLFGDADVAQMPWTGPPTIASARRLACDCHLTPIVIDDGIPLDLRRTSRTLSEEATPRPRRARPGLRVSRMRCAACPLRGPPRETLDRRWPNRPGQPGAALPVPPPPTAPLALASRDSRRPNAVVHPTHFG